MAPTVDEEEPSAGLGGANGSPPASNPPSDSTSQSANNSNSNSNNLAIFCREVRNLLRSKPNCMIPFSKFVPAYHNHYGRQCCVYQFGFTKLIELLEAIPHVVQILGDSGGSGGVGGSGTTNRYITLTHREQIKRFASDLIKVVKSQPGKRLRLSQFAQAYEQVLGRTFRVEDYGTNNINVLLAEIWEGTINIIPINRDSMLAESHPDEQADRDHDHEQDQDNDDDDDDDNNNDFGHDHDHDHEHDHDDDDDDDDKGAKRQGSSHSAADRRRKRRGHRIVQLKPLFVDVPLPRNNPVLEQLVAANELVNKPYISLQHPDCWFEIPRRERSEKEIKRTKYFVWDCIELLAKMKQNQFAVPFSKFIPAYHYYFNRQCKVSIFGFSKLIDLFESISPEVVEILEQGAGEEKLIRLAPKYWPKPAPARPPGGLVTRRPFGRSHGADYVIMSSSSSIGQRKGSHVQQPGRPFAAAAAAAAAAAGADEKRPQRPADRDSLNGLDEPIEDEEDEEDEEVDGDEEEDEDEEVGEEELVEGEQFVGECQRPSQQPSQQMGQQMGPIDSGPTEEELLELEDELKAYEELQAIQRRRSGRMAAILDIFKYSIYY